MKIFEVFMLICFGFAWPASIYKSVTSKSIKGKSVLFLYVVIIGYICGIINKFINNLDYVTILYGINAVMVFVDLLLYYKNKRLSIKTKLS